MAERPISSVHAEAQGGGNQRRRLATWLALAVPLFIVVVGAWQYRWVDEDAFIDFRIVSNILAGHGPVYNVGERVETYSDPLWVASLVFLRGALPFVGIEWWSVILGLTSTGGGVLLGGRGVQRLWSRSAEGVILPIGLLIFSVVAGVWEFATSGLEMGMVFLWLGLCFWLLVRLSEERRRPEAAAAVVTLGPLIRPELLLMSGALTLGVAALVGLPDWKGRRSIVRRWVVPAAVGLALPLLYEVWRMAYFAMLVPNTGLAKAAGAAWWSEGFDYLWNFISPYTLWVPMLAAAPFVVLLTRRMWSRGDLPGLAVLAAVLLAGLLDLLYVVRVGGDYMHARLLLPSFFAVCLTIALPATRLRTLLVVPALIVAVWAVVCAGWLRNTEAGLNPVIINTRTATIATTHNPHPITAEDYQRSVLALIGAPLKGIAESVPARHQRILYGNFHTIPGNGTGSGRLVAATGAIGVIGYLAGPSVYIFDTQSLANPIGSHTSTLLHFRPGHNKPIGAVWMYGRFGQPGLTFSVGGPPPNSVAAAREAMSCPPLSSFLSVITGPWTFGKAISNIAHSVTYTKLSFSANPNQADHQLCHRGLTTAFAPKSGYWLLGSNGKVYSFGAPSLGSQTVACAGWVDCATAIASTPDGGGYSVVFGDAYGSSYAATGNIAPFGEAIATAKRCTIDLNGHLVPSYNQLVRWTAVAASPATPGGYWLVGPNDLAACGDVSLMGGPPLDSLGTWSGIASTPDGNGYWITTTDGAVYPFGDARDFGSMAGHHLNGPVDGIVPTADGGGYWLVATDGGVFAFGDAAFSGSTGAHPYPSPVVGLANDPDGTGYWTVAQNGKVFAFGAAPVKGSLGTSSAHVVGIASRAG